MDRVSDFFKDLKERLSNPLFSSFIIAWIVFNWKIPVVLLYYKISELKIDGYNSYLDYITRNLNDSNAIWKPLCAALIYTFIFPFIRNGILAFNSWVKAWGNSWNLSLSKESKVSVSKYIQLRQAYLERASRLEEVLNEEGQFLKKNKELGDQVFSLQEERNRSLTELEKWQSANDPRLLNGEWEISYPKDNRPIYRVRIQDGIMEYLDPPPSDRNGKTGIRSFFYRPNGKNLSFIVAFDDGSRNNVYHLYFLDIVADMRILRGTEDERTSVEFKKNI